MLLENLRFYKEEEKGDEAFAEKLSKHGVLSITMLSLSWKMENISADGR